MGVDLKLWTDTIIIQAYFLEFSIQYNISDQLLHSLHWGHWGMVQENLAADMQPVFDVA